MSDEKKPFAGLTGTELDGIHESALPRYCTFTALRVGEMLGFVPHPNIFNQQTGLTNRSNAVRRIRNS
jgi:hypothetical protein